VRQGPWLSTKRGHAHSLTLNLGGKTTLREGVKLLPRVGLKKYWWKKGPFNPTLRGQKTQHLIIKGLCRAPGLQPPLSQFPGQ